MGSVVAVSGTAGSSSSETRTGFVVAADGGPAAGAAVGAPAGDDNTSVAVELMVVGEDVSVPEDPPERPSPNERATPGGSVDTTGELRSLAESVDLVASEERAAPALSVELERLLARNTTKPARANSTTAAVDASATIRPLEVALPAVGTTATSAVGSGAGKPSALQSNALEASTARVVPMASSVRLRIKSGATARGMAENKTLGLVIARRRSVHTAHLSR
jgi:hypothetical protein